MKNLTNKELRRARDEDFKRRELPRMLWHSQQDGTAIRVNEPRPHYEMKPKVEKKKWKPTEAQDNAIGRRIRRRQNKAMRGFRPHAKR